MAALLCSNLICNCFDWLFYSFYSEFVDSALKCSLELKTVNFSGELKSEELEEVEESEKELERELWEDWSDNKSKSPTVSVLELSGFLLFSTITIFLLLIISCLSESNIL